MKINSSRPRAGRPQELMRDIGDAQEAEVEVDEQADAHEIAGLIESLSPDQQTQVVRHTASLLGQMPLAAQQSALGGFDASARNAMMIGGIGGLGVGALVTGLRATNNPYLVLAGTIASGIAAGYIVNSFPKKRLNVAGKLSGPLGSLEFGLDAETSQAPTK